MSKTELKASDIAEIEWLLIEGGPVSELRPDLRDRLRRNIRSLIARYADNPTKVVDPERVAQLIAHRACGGNEHDGMSKFHGNCVVCLVPWPCEYAGKPPTP